MSGHVAGRRKDSEGDFLRNAGIVLAGAGGNLECVTAGGIRLGLIHPAGSTEQVFRELQAIREKWRSLPARQRKPGAVKVGAAGLVAPNVQSLAPPENALILRTYHRILTREKDGRLRKARVSDYPLKAARVETWQTHFGARWEAQPDFMWIREEEWKRIVRPNPVVGDTYPLLEAVADRMTRAHLDGRMAYGECGMCRKEAVRSRSLTLTVTAVSADLVQLRLEGSAALGADFATSVALDKKGRLEGRSVEGFEPKVLGYLTWDCKANRFTRFDVIALGDAYGTPHGNDPTYYRAGRYPVGISMELASGSTPAERVPPRASVLYDTPNPQYFATGD